VSSTKQRKKQPVARNPPIDLEKEKRDTEAGSRVLQTVAEQENDPVAVQMIRLLRANGSSDTQIRQTLRGFFGPAKPSPSIQSIGRSLPERQIDNRQQIIDQLASELETLRTGNCIMSQYEELLRTTAAPLLRNAEELGIMERGCQGSADEPVVSDYAALRAAVLKFLQAEETVDDDELIAQLNETHGSEEDDL
jgi:hypothetical protein